jgi:hypothetical protein
MRFEQPRQGASNRNLKKPMNMKIQPIVIRCMAVGALVLLVSGCCSTGKHGDVAREWSLMMREQQIAPIFPPREDIRIGDVYLSRNNPNTINAVKAVLQRRDFLEIPILFYRTNLEATIKADYTHRPPYPLTPASILVPVAKTTTNIVTTTNLITSTTIGTNLITTITVSNNVAVSTNTTSVPKTNVVVTGTPVTVTNIVTSTNLVATPTGEEPTENNIFENAAPNCLRHVAFPEFSFANVSSGSIQAVIPVEAMNLAVAGTCANARDGFVKISSAESISLPVKEVLDPVRGALLTNGSDSCPNTASILKEDWRRILNSLAASSSKAKSTTTNFYLTVISEVIYARSIDVGFTTKKSSGGGANVAGNPHTNAIDMAAGAVARANALNQINADLLSKTTPGGSVMFTSASDFGIGLRRTYTRPMAVGYRGLVLELARCGDQWKLASMRVADSTVLNPLFTPQNPATPTR